MMHNGLYEQIINKRLDKELSETDKLSQTAPIDRAEASKVLAKYVAEITEKGLDSVKDNGGDLNFQVNLVNRIVSTIMTETKETDFDTLSVAVCAEQLLVLFDKKNSVLAPDEKTEIIRPETSIAQSSLFTGAVHEPQMFTELKKEIVSCNRIDMLVSFIKWSGLRLIMDELTTFTRNGGQLRIITTSYMGATDVKAIEELRKLLLRYNYDRIDFIDKPVYVGFDCPLDLHCTYTRDQILVALDFMKPSTVREGVKWLPDKNIDVFFVTLNKADKDYSPTTMYNDYSINSELFHWQSQSTTAENSTTGQRYIHHREKGSRILLFVREFKSDIITVGAAAYTYLGTANYVKHEGSRPMNITWKLDYPIPAKYLKKTNKLVVG